VDYMRISVWILGWCFWTIWVRLGSKSEPGMLPWRKNRKICNFCTTCALSTTVPIIGSTTVCVPTVHFYFLCVLKGTRLCPWGTGLCTSSYIGKPSFSL